MEAAVNQELEEDTKQEKRGAEILRKHLLKHLIQTGQHEHTVFEVFICE